MGKGFIASESKKYHLSLESHNTEAQNYTHKQKNKQAQTKKQTSTHKQARTHKKTNKHAHTHNTQHTYTHTTHSTQHTKTHMHSYRNMHTHAHGSQPMNCSHLFRSLQRETSEMTGPCADKRAQLPAQQYIWTAASPCDNSSTSEARAETESQARKGRNASGTSTLVQRSNSSNVRSVRIFCIEIAKENEGSLSRPGQWLQIGTKTARVPSILPLKAILPHDRRVRRWEESPGA